MPGWPGRGGVMDDGRARARYVVEELSDQLRDGHVIFDHEDRERLLGCSLHRPAFVRPAAHI
jgi:hypothetical protein